MVKLGASLFFAVNGFTYFVIFQTLIKNLKNSILTLPFHLHINPVPYHLGQASDRWLSGGGTVCLDGFW